MNTTGFSKEKALNDPNYIEWEYALETMYWEVMREVQLKMYSILNDFNEFTIPYQTSNIVLVLYLFVIASSFLIVLAFWSIVR